jgi:hypothetical protein
LSQKKKRECHEHGAIVLRHSEDEPNVGLFELQVAADEARLIVVQQVVEAIVENERAHAIEEIGDAAHDEISVDREEEGVVHAAVLAVDDAAGLTDLMA